MVSSHCPSPRPIRNGFLRLVLYGGVNTAQRQTPIQDTRLGQGNVFTGVCDSVHRGRGCVCLSACWDTTTPLEQTPPRADTPPESRPPGSRHSHPTPDPPPPGSRLRHTVNERPVGILLDCILVYQYLYLSRSLCWPV